MDVWYVFYIFEITKIYKVTIFRTFKIFKMKLIFFKKYLFYQNLTSITLGVPTSRPTPRTGPSTARASRARHVPGHDVFVLREGDSEGEKVALLTMAGMWGFF